MDIHKIQRTGDMHYVYLPTAWCKEHKIGPASKVSLGLGSNGSLIITPRIIEKKHKNLQLSIKDDNLDIINKLVVACYINPLDSFTINLEKELDQRKLLDQKRLISVELMEIEGKKIVSESSFDAGEPDILLKTMISKVRNMLIVMTSNYNEELIQRYEEEIDKNRMMIDKAIISAMTFSRESKIKTINLHYIALIARALERAADHLITLDKKDVSFFIDMAEIISSLKDVIEIAIDQNKKLDYNDVINFVRKAYRVKDEKITDINMYHKIRIRHYFGSISEVLMDWAITNETET